MTRAAFLLVAGLLCGAAVVAQRSDPGGWPTPLSPPEWHCQPTGNDYDSLPLSACIAACPGAEWSVVGWGTPYSREEAGLNPFLWAPSPFAGGVARQLVTPAVAICNPERAAIDAVLAADREGLWWSGGCLVEYPRSPYRGPQVWCGEALSAKAAADPDYVAHAEPLPPPLAPPASQRHCWLWRFFHPFASGTSFAAVISRPSGPVFRGLVRLPTRVPR